MTTVPAEGVTAGGPRVVIWAGGVEEWQVGKTNEVGRPKGPLRT